MSWSIEGIVTHNLSHSHSSDSVSSSLAHGSYTTGTDYWVSNSSGGSVHHYGTKTVEWLKTDWSYASFALSSLGGIANTRSYEASISGSYRQTTSFEDTRESKETDFSGSYMSSGSRSTTSYSSHDHAGYSWTSSSGLTAYSEIGTDNGLTEINNPGTGSNDSHEPPDVVIASTSWLPTTLQINSTTAITTNRWVITSSLSGTGTDAVPTTTITLQQTNTTVSTQVDDPTSIHDNYDVTLTYSKPYFMATSFYADDEESFCIAKTGTAGTLYWTDTNAHYTTTSYSLQFDSGSIFDLTTCDISKSDDETFDVIGGTTNTIGAAGGGVAFGYGYNLSYYTTTYDRITNRSGLDWSTRSTAIEHISGTSAVNVGYVDDIEWTSYSAPVTSVFTIADIATVEKAESYIQELTGTDTDPWYTEGIEIQHSHLMTTGKRATIESIVTTQKFECWNMVSLIDTTDSGISGGSTSWSSTESENAAGNTYLTMPTSSLVYTLSVGSSVLYCSRLTYEAVAQPTDNFSGTVGQDLNGGQTSWQSLTPPNHSVDRDVCYPIIAYSVDSQSLNSVTYIGVDTETSESGVLSVASGRNATVMSIQPGSSVGKGGRNFSTYPATLWLDGLHSLTSINSIGGTGGSTTTITSGSFLLATNILATARPVPIARLNTDQYIALAS